MRAKRQIAAVFLTLSLALTLLAKSGVGSKKLTLTEFVEHLPTRVSDKDGTPGDMVNFVLVGSRRQVRTALQAAGWKEVDRTSTESAVRAILSTIQKKPYTELPMSELFLFGRAQDLGYARAEPIRVVAERHHFRLWEAPWKTESGERIWIGAGTHDIGFEEDQRSGAITHKIDPEVDKERKFIAATLQEAGKVRGMGFVRPANPVREATTAHGGPFRSDGRVLILILK